MWGRTGECLCALVVLLVVGVVQGRHHPTLGNEVDDVDQRAKDLMDSFSQVDHSESRHKIRHHHHRRKKGPHAITHKDPGEEEYLLPLYPKNVSEETLVELRRLKRQYYPPTEYGYGGQAAGQAQAQYYVTEDGTEWRDDGRGEEWSAPSPCSRSCGGGVAHQERICRDHMRLDGSCGDGPNKRFFSCNTQDCPPNQEDFRAEQCAAFNTVPFEGRYYQWIPYTKAPNKCELNCMPQGERFYYRHKRQVIDGTSCDDEDRQVCVNGKCLPVGCDNVLGSRAREDKCRKCGGDGVGCHTVQGVFDSNNNLQVGYNDVLLIPMGATNILVKEKRASNNYLAVRNTSNHYYLNGNWRIDFPRELSFANTIFHYERKPHSFFAPESVRALGPISEALYIVVLYQESNPGIEYEYSISDKDHHISLTTPGTYYWTYDDFTQCSATCGGGYQQRYVYCVRRTEQLGVEYVEEDLCDLTQKPQTQQSCNPQPCPLRWYAGPWEPCSAKCGSNEVGVQYRTVFCEQTIQGARAIVSDEARCEAEIGRPPEKAQRCTGEVEGGVCASWFVSEWGACSTLCGEGMEKRTVKCHAKKDNVTNTYEDSHCAEEKPEDTRSCYPKPCEGVDWITGPWSGCKASADPCDDTLNPQETRQVYCANAKGKVFSDEFCHDYRKPNNTRECNSEGSSTPATEEENQCQFAWFAMQWGECLLTSCSQDNTTGQIRGQKKRLVFCGTLNSDGSVTKVEDDSKCNDTKKYDDTEACDLDEEFVKAECFEKASWFTGPWSKCSKDCGSGQRTRQVICMVGNESTTDVKKCGEEEIVFSTEDCEGDCEVATTGDEMMTISSTAASAEDGSSPKPSMDIEGMRPGIDCESDYEEDYYYFYDLEGSGTTESMEDKTTTGMEELLVTEEGSAEDELGSGVDMPSGEVSGDGELPEMGKSTTGSDALISTKSPEMEASGSGSGEMDEASDLSTTSSSSLSTDSTSETGTAETSEGSEGTTEGMTTEEGTTAEGGEETTTEGEESTTTEEPSTTTEELPQGDMPETTTEEAEETETTTAGEETETTESDAETTTGTEGTTEEGTATSTLPPSTTTESVLDYDLLAENKMAKMTDGSGEMSGSGSGEMEMDTEKPVVVSEGSGMGEEMEDIVSGSGSGEPEKLMGSTSEAPRTTLEDALKAETKLPKCPPRKKPVVEPETNCSTSSFGCCPNGKDPATGPFGAGCKIPKTCEETKHGCCPDGVTPAEGPLKRRGCPMPDCEKTLYGCCPDGKTAAEGNDFLNCEKPCDETEHGCCPDGKTPKKGPKGRGCPKVKCEDTKFGCCPGEDKGIAEGPNFQGCKEIVKDNCTASFFGCCLDGKTAALGEKEEGCPEMPPCVSEEFGCCEDEVTSAHGPNKEGCCLSSQFGCCPDNIQAATGPNLDGCTCKNSLYGCCPDNTTAARGPDGECGCKFTEHGCCPDGYTTASGPNNEGCSCSTFQHGCCPDGEAVAKGPNKEGCGCEFTEFGCCPDRRTPKQGEEDSCGCESSWFGCCPDGKTEAKGEDFEGCEDIPIKPGDVCGLEKERGSCRNFTVKWFFDMEYGGCSRFWYGGCDGNLNRFGSQDECKAVCVEPEGRDACYLPQVAGPCEGYYPSWYYDPQREMCLQFVYGGCLGNNNRFASREQCENHCLMPDRVDACDQPKTDGPCKGNFTRFYFDKTEEKCKLFQYGGCKGNNNNFLTERECEQRCSQEGRIRAGLEQCTQRPSEPKEINCAGAEMTRWYYDIQVGTCLKFTYGGCGNSNSNMFVSRAECLSVCGNGNFTFPNLLGGEWFVPPDKGRNSCFLPRREGPCGEKLARWHYDTNEQRCVPFYYGGCQGNANRFNTLQDCEKTCPAALLAENICVQPPLIGECTSYTERYYYDPYEGRCKAFVYSGCGGNSNNFMLVDDCRNRCENSYVPQPVVSTPNEFNTAYCFQSPPEHGVCYGSDPSRIQVKWFYDSADGVCKQFRFYPDCEAHTRNPNRFDSMQDCEDRCETAQDLCSLPQVQGPCSGNFTQYFYDTESDTCQTFMFGGCQGNGNRFDSLVQCEQRCKKVPDAGRSPYDTGYGQPEEADIERQRQEEERRRYYEEYERQRQAAEDERRRLEDERARSGGEEEATTVGPFIGQEDICSLPMEIGPCRASVPAYYFDSRTRKCQAFIYGGCQGNANRFETEEQCERQCGQYRQEDVCRIPQADPGPCRARMPKWYFNPSDRTCQQFMYGGCGGNGNRFSSREECESICHSKTEIVRKNDTITAAAVCRLVGDPGTCTEEYKRWYYDFEQNTCIPFNFGGCGGNLNKFPSFEACLDYCQRALQYEYAAQQQPAGVQPRHAETEEGHQYVGPPEEPGQTGENEIGLEECREELEACRHLQCPYGVEKMDVGLCPQCECREPCRNFPCAEDEQCAVDIVGTIAQTRQGPSYGFSHEASFRPVCRKREKAGTCPNLWDGGSGNRIGICAQECSSDADCSGELKCCSNGCGTSCMMPQAEETETRVQPPYPTYGGGGGYGRPEQPARILSTSTEVEAEEGSLARLECLCRGNPQPHVSWRFNNAEVNVETGRFRALQDGSVLQIIGVYKRDEGVYTCVADNGIGRPAALDITLVVTEPTQRQAAIVEEDTEPNVIVSLGSAASLRCFAMGWPRPSVTWWKGEKMLPFSSERYEQMRDYSLLIRLVSLRDLGPYTCQAYNGQGKAASWTVTVQTLGPVTTAPTGEDREFLQYVITARRPAYVGTNFTRPGAGRPGPVGGYQPPVWQPQPLTTTSTTERAGIPNYLVPLRTHISMEKTLYPSGNDIVIPCEVEGYPHPSVHWYHDDVPIQGDERVQVFNENELRIYNSTTQDSGVYRCDAVNEYGSSSSSVSIQVEGIYLHPNCTDNPFFANCKLIVKANYCTNKYYARFCCKSCTLAGQLPQYGPHLQEFGQAYFRRGQVEYAPTNTQSQARPSSRGSNSNNPVS